MGDFNIDNIVRTEEGETSLSPSNDELLVEFNKIPLEQQLPEIFEILKKLFSDVQSLEIEGFKNQNIKALILNQLTYATNCLNILAKDIKTIKTCYSKYEIEKAVSMLEGYSSQIKSNAIAIINAGSTLSSEKNQDTMRTLAELHKIVQSLKEHNSIVTMGEKGLIAMLNSYKSKCENGLDDMLHQIGSFSTNSHEAIREANEQTSKSLTSFVRSVKSTTIRFAALVGIGSFILGGCIIASLIIGKQVLDLRAEKNILDKSIKDKENFAKMLSGVEFYNENDMFYVTFAKDLKAQQRTTRDGDIAIGYSKKR